MYAYGTQPTRNNRGLAHENGAIESPHGHPKKRGAHRPATTRKRLADLVAYRRFIDEIVGAHNARNAKRIQAETALLQALAPDRISDYE